MIKLKDLEGLKLKDFVIIENAIYTEVKLFFQKSIVLSIIDPIITSSIHQEKVKYIKELCIFTYVDENKLQLNFTKDNLILYFDGITTWNIVKLF